MFKHKCEAPGELLAANNSSRAPAGTHQEVEYEVGNGTERDGEVVATPVPEDVGDQRVDGVAD